MSYESWKDIIIPLISACIGGGLTLLGVILTIKSSINQWYKEIKEGQKLLKENSLAAIKMEIIENKLLLDEYLSNIKENEIGIKTMYIRLHNLSWINFRHEMFKDNDDTDLVVSLLNAYIAINETNNISNAALSFVNSEHINDFPLKIKVKAEKTQGLVDKAIEHMSKWERGEPNNSNQKT